MSTKKKIIVTKPPLKKTAIIIKSKVPAKPSPFAKKIEEINAMLAKTKFMDS
jgi:hypothetical protein